MTTHVWNDENDYTQGGYFTEYGEKKLGEWTFDADTRVISVRVGLKGKTRDLSEFNPEWLTDDELRKRLPDLAKEMAEQVRGEPFPA